MLNFNDPKNLIHSEDFLRQPTDEASELLKKSAAKKIILFGERGSGKTTVLYNHEYKSIETENPAIFTRFELASLFENNKINLKGAFNNDFIIYYYEVIMAYKILCFIENNYKEIFFRYFASNKEPLIKLIYEIDDYIKNHRLKEMSFSAKISIGDITANQIERFKKIAKLNSLTLMIDRFDWTDGNSEIAQKILSEYFKLFDKSIITTDDESIVNEISTRISLAKKGFDLIEINYGKDIEIIKKLIALKINNYNSNLPEQHHELPIEQFSDEVYKKLLQKANGNISVILSVISDMSLLYQEEYDDKTNFISNIEYYLDKQIAGVRRLKKMNRPVKLLL